MKLEINYNLNCFNHKLKNYYKDFEDIVNVALEIDEIKNRLKSDETYFLDVSFISSGKIKKINEKYRNVNRTTDVISFAFWDNGIVSPLLGEMFINVKQAKKQAKMYEHSFRREICFLFTHGLLHIFGFDHMNIEDEKVMFGLQDKILDKLMIGRNNE